MSEHELKLSRLRVTQARVRKLKWLCRRGMKELDVLLEQFIADQTSTLEQGGWPELESLLALEDDQLWDCIQYPESANASFHNLLRSISSGSSRID